MSRYLTAGEIELARLIYGDGINYSDVVVHNEKYVPWHESYAWSCLLSSRQQEG